MSRKDQRGKGYVERTPENPIFINAIVKNAIKKEARIWKKKIISLGMDVGKDVDDLEGDMWVLWCESCRRHPDKPEAFVCTDFQRNSAYKLKEFCMNYFEALKGNPDVPGPEPFEPDFYQFTDFYRNGYTIDDLAEHYGVSESTIKRYMSCNFVTKRKIDPQLYLDCHEKLHGRDVSYWNIRSELITKFEVD